MGPWGVLLIASGGLLIYWVWTTSKNKPLSSIVERHSAFPNPVTGPGELTPSYYGMTPPANYPATPLRTY